MICLSAERIMLGSEPAIRIDVHVPEEELYDSTVSTLEDVRQLLRSAALPKKRFRLPPTPFTVRVLEETREIVIEFAEAWEGNFPGQRLRLISKTPLIDLDWVIGKHLEFRQLEAIGE